MDPVRLGRTGLEASPVGFGTVPFGKTTDERPRVPGLDEARPMFRAAWEGGITFFDTAHADAEGTSEETTGQDLRELAPRHEIGLATKAPGRMRPGPKGQDALAVAALDLSDEEAARLLLTPSRRGPPGPAPLIGSPPWAGPPPARIDA